MAFKKQQRKGSFTTLETMETCLSDVCDRDDFTLSSSSYVAGEGSDSSRGSGASGSSSSVPCRGILSVRTQAESLSQKCKPPKVIAPEEAASATAANPQETTIGFSKVQFREYDRVVGVNPAVRDGVPLTLSWDLQNEYEFELDAYEQSRPARRERNELCIPSAIRHQMMRDAGFSRDDIMKWIKKANIARNQRNHTNNTAQLAKAEELTQKVFRGVLNKTLRASKKRQERKLIEEHLEKDRQMQLKWEEMRQAQLKQRLIET